MLSSDFITEPPAGTGTTISYEITFDGYAGALELLVPDTSELVAESGAVVSAEVISLQEGTEPLRGDFTLSFRGAETVALSYDATADEVLIQEEQLYSESVEVPFKRQVNPNVSLYTAML